MYCARPAPQVALRSATENRPKGRTESVLTLICAESSIVLIILHRYYCYICENSAARELNMLHQP